MSDHRTLSLISLALAASVGIVASASRAEAQVAQGELVYVEGEDGRATLHRRIDSSGEGDGQLTEPAIANGDTFVRPRLGLSFHGGGTVGDPEGWMLGGSLRVGVQVGEWFGAYYQPTGIYAALQSSAGDERDGALVLWNSFLAEATLFHLLSIGVGPSVDYYADCDGTLQESAGCAREGSFFGMHGRVALNRGAQGPGQRGALTISLDAHPTWFGDGLETVSFLAGLGVEMY